MRSMFFVLPGFEEKDLRACGQVRQEVRSYKEVLDLTLRAWRNLDRGVFQAAWVACGYFDYAHMAQFDDKLDVTAHTQSTAANVLADAFSCCGRGHWSPQRCTKYEWQLQDRYVLKLLTCQLAFHIDFNR